MYNQITANKRKTALLIVVFFVFIVGLVTVFDYIYQGGYTFTAYALLFSIPTALFSYYKGDWVALRTAGAIPITKEDNPYVVRMVENLCITAGMPTPKIHIIPDPAMNAFATGRDPEHASIAITEGLIRNLENEELEGVIAHELSHIKNFDIRVMTVVIILVGFIALLADFFLRAQFFGFGGRRDNREGDARIGAVLAIVGVVLAILAPLVAQLIQFAVSRKREFLADASGALLTRYPEGLARALEKISANARPVARASNATAHLYISNPFKGGRHFLGKLFSTHPPIEERITALRSMA